MLPSAYEVLESGYEKPPRQGMTPKPQEASSKAAPEPRLFVTSLDFELHWCVRDKLSAYAYRDNLLGAPEVVPAFLKLFTKYGIRATITLMGFPFVNMHDGIAPLYRGGHEAYWTLTEENRSACGIALHLVDAGLNTGGILAQEVIDPGLRTTTTQTYYFLPLQVGLPLPKGAIRDAAAVRIRVPHLQKLSSASTALPWASNYGTDYVVATSER